MGKVKNLEFKAKVNEIESYEQKLLTLDPEFKGLDHQVDTYFNVPHGRLKLREGNIEHALIQYNRENLPGSKQSDVILYQHQPDPALKEILTLQFGIKKIVDKKRKIYFVDNVKFHFDVVEGLGTFLEVEAIDKTSELSSEYLKSQCDYYKDFFGLKDADMLEGSYSDML
jgi:predicted adenylyl cyclase CyaB